MSYDLAGRLLTETTGSGTLSYQYDQAANRSRVTWPDGFYTTTTHDALERALVIADSAGNTLASYGYDTLGRRNAIARGNATSTSFAYDNADRLTSLSQAFTGANVTFALTYNPASQILVRTVSNGTYDIGAPAAQNLAKTYDGLNRDATIAAIGTQPCSTASGYDCEQFLPSPRATASRRPLPEAHRDDRVGAGVLVRPEGYAGRNRRESSCL